MKRGGARVREAERWLQQAAFDLEGARVSAAGGRHEWACFQAQQADEMALKALLFALGVSGISSHSLLDVLGVAVKGRARVGTASPSGEDARRPLPGHAVPRCAPRRVGPGNEIWSGGLQGMRRHVRIDIHRLDEVRQRLGAFVAELKRRFRIARVILFGSFARGDEDVHELSDIDLVIIGEVPGRFEERIGTVRDMTDLLIEPLVYTQEEWERARADENSFLDEVQETGVDL